MSNVAEVATNGCEGCWHCQFAGIRWPASPDGFTDLSYVDRCDYCEAYASDDEAAKALAEHFGVRWGYARREADPMTEADIRWEPPDDDDLDYTGWSAFIDRPERDGRDSPARDGNWVDLNLNPGQARAVVQALTDSRINMAAEWSHGDRDAVATGNTLEALRDEIETALRGT